MNVTPSPKMLHAMQKLVESTIGPAPSQFECSSAANDRRAKREMMMSVLHSLVALSMREGVNRAVIEARERLWGAQDSQDRGAISKAKEDAERGGALIQLPTH